MRNAIFICIFIFFKCIVAAQTHIVGTVKDSYGYKVPFATIKWKKDTVSLPTKFCIADSGGKYQLIVRAGYNGWVEVSAVGYDDYRLYIKNDTSLIIKDIYLNVRQKALEAITIQSKPSITVSGDTTSYLVERFKRGNENNINDLLSNIPGFIISQTGRVMYNGKLIDRVLINGDDISGNSYAYLLSQLDVAGIEDIQVIKNYADNSSILSSLSYNNGQVLNINYHKAYLNRIFGNLKAAIARGGKTDAGLQALGLFNRSKILFIQSFNSLGNRSMVEDNGNDDMLIGTALELDNDFKLLDNNPYYNAGDEALDVKFVNDFYNNSTGLATINSLLRPTSKILLKSRIGFTYDNYAKRSATATEFFLGQGTAKIEQSTEVQKNITGFNGFVNLNYINNKKEQLLLTLKGLSNVNEYNGTNKLSGASIYNETMYSPKKQFGSQLTFNKIFKHQEALAIALQYQSNKIYNLYYATPPLYRKFFSLSDPYDSLSQNEFHQFYSYSLQTKFFKKIKSHIISMSFQLKDHISNINNSIGFINTGVVNTISPDSINKVKLNQLSFSGEVQYTWKTSPKLNMSIAGTLSFFRNTSYDFDTNLPLTTQRFQKIFPRINLQYRFSKDAQLVVTGHSVPRFIDPKFIGGGIVIQGLTSIRQNLKALDFRTSNSLSVTYSHTDLFGKRKLFFSSLSYSNTPLFFLSKIHPQIDYTYFKSVPFDESTHTISLFLSLQKISKDFRKRVTPTLTFAFGHSYGVMDNVQVSIPFKQLQPGFNFLIDFKRLQLKTYLQYTLTDQEVSSRALSQVINSSATANYKLTSQLFFDFEAKYCYSKSHNAVSDGIFIIGASCLYKSPNTKWDIGIKANNLTNQTTYTTAALTTTYLATTNYYLYPRVVYAFAKYRF